MPHEDHSHAGQGPVLLDIGGDVGAIVLSLPEALAGVEIEVCPAGAERDPSRWPHVAVIGRPLGSELVHTAVFPALPQGSYELYRKPDGPTELTVRVSGGRVSEARWPDG